MKRIIIAILLGCMILTGCKEEPENMVDGPDMERQYHQISQEEAMKMMENESDYVIVDVRTMEEYLEGHIPDAICIPVESITNQQPSQLPDLNQTILVYCRSGNRSKQAAQKLLELGYSKIYEFGGINTWPGEIVKD
ncbi:MAG: rhodanese-like domain-containing protein [Erysipelotrichaceae bacterium]|nr:rhodanese-like domain-containing protein [Erysipelotrichaceae bacterium]